MTWNECCKHKHTDNRARSHLKKGVTFFLYLYPNNNTPPKTSFICVVRAFYIWLDKDITPHQKSRSYRLKINLPTGTGPVRHPYPHTPTDLPTLWRGRGEGSLYYPPSYPHNRGVSGTAHGSLPEIFQKFSSIPEGVASFSSRGYYMQCCILYYMWYYVQNVI